MSTRQPSLVLTSLTAMLLGCSGPEPEPIGPPCEEDVTNCTDNSSKFMEDPTCELEGELDLVFGEGFEEFVALSEGASPTLYTGFQGGQHVFLGVRVVNADLERPQLKINATFDYCEVGCEDPNAWLWDIQREVVVDASSLTTTTEGWYEVHSILIPVFDWRFAATQRIEMQVMDPCGRQGVYIHESSGS